MWSTRPGRLSGDAREHHDLLIRGQGVKPYSCPGFSGAGGRPYGITGRSLVGWANSDGLEW